MYKRIISQNDFDIVTLSEAKAQCHLTTSFDKDNEYIAGLILACCELSQTYTKRLLSVGNVSVVVENYERSTTLPFGEIVTITEVVGTDLNGDEVEIVDYTFNVTSQKIRIPDAYIGYTDITINYECGYAIAPKKVKQGVLMMVASMYNNREDGLVGQSYESLPFTSLKLLNSVRL